MDHGDFIIIFTPINFILTKYRSIKKLEMVHSTNVSNDFYK